MDGKFDDVQKLEAGGTVVKVGGPLRNAVGLTVEVHVIVMQDGVVADGKGKNEPGGTAWSGQVDVLSGNPFEERNATAYAVAVGTGDGGMSTYHWFATVRLEQ